MRVQPSTIRQHHALPFSFITIQVNGHPVKITTDQPITLDYIREIADHVRRIEAQPRRGRS
jgi:hypothetical protein